MAEERPATIEEIISAFAKQQGIPPTLALAVAKRESSLDPNAVGDSGQAIGLFQLHPGAAKDTGTADRSDPLQNIQGGVKYLKLLNDRYKGDVNKILMAYNGGMEGVDAGTPSPAAQAYANDILGSLSQPAEPAASAAPATTTPAPTARESLEARRKRVMSEKPTEPLLDVAKGFGKRAVETVGTLGQMVRKRFPILDAAPWITVPVERTNLAQNIGAGVEQMAEFAVPASKVAAGAKGLNIAGRLAARGVSAGRAALAAAAAEAPAQAAVGYGVSKAQGASETGAQVNAALGAAGPVAGAALKIGGGAIRERAVKQLSRVFATALENKTPKMVDYALKTGEAATPEVAKAAQIVRKAAADTLDLPIRASWGKWQTLLAKDVTAKGQTLEQAIKGPFGSTEVPRDLVVQALRDLKTTTAHLAETQSGDFAEQVFNKPLAAEIAKLEEFLNASGQNKVGYGPSITVRNLVDLKRTWDDYVYTLSTAGKVGLTPEALVTTAMKKAIHAGANGIRSILEEAAPDIAQLNGAVTDAIRLQDLVGKLYEVSPAMGTTGQLLTRGASVIGGGYLGAAAGGHWIIGSSLGGATAHVLVKAVESPLWQTASPALKNQLANAIASGNADLVRRIAVPFVQAGTVKSTKEPVGATAAPAR